MSRRSRLPLSRTVPKNSMLVAARTAAFIAGYSWPSVGVGETDDDGRPEVDPDPPQAATATAAAAASTGVAGTRTRNITHSSNLNRLAHRRGHVLCRARHAGRGANTVTDRQAEAAASAEGIYCGPPAPRKRHSPSGGHRGRPRVLNAWRVTHARQLLHAVEEPETGRREHTMIRAHPVPLPARPLANPNPRCARATRRAPVYAHARQLRAGLQHGEGPLGEQAVLPLLGHPGQQAAAHRVGARRRGAPRRGSGRPARPPPPPPAPPPPPPTRPAPAPPP